MIYLASASPRRRELLTQIGIPFQLLSIAVDESIASDEAADDYVLRMAHTKAIAGIGKAIEHWPILAADTIVVCDQRILGKPKDKAEAISMLRLLSGRAHQVKTAIAVAFDDCIKTSLVTTEVVFRALSSAELEAYWASGEPQDKAGSYGIQGIAGKFVARINGSYSSVVGLPLMETERLLATVSAETQA